MDKEKLVEKLFESIITFMPVLYKKMYKDPFKDCMDGEITRQQLELLYFISLDDGKSMTSYGNKMMVPKSNLTVIADKLIEEGYIMRQYDPDDRRVIILKLTEKGEEFLNDFMVRHKRDMIDKFDPFAVDDIQRLIEIVEEVKSIVNKLEDKGQ